MPAKKLSPEQLQEAAALRKRYEEFAAEERANGRAGTQEALSERLGFGQSALNQYLGGKIPLGGDAVLAFATLFGVRPWEISPSVTATQVDQARRWLIATGNAVVRREIEVFEMLNLENKVHP